MSQFLDIPPNVPIWQCNPMGKPAVTHYRVMEHFRVPYPLTFASRKPVELTKIRVHTAHIHHPLIGDQLYGGRPRVL